MPGRVTQSMLNTQLIRNLNSNLQRMDNQQNQLSTGRRINKPSDDPVGITFAMRYRSELSANDQYQSNVDAATSWLEYTDTMMDQAGSVLQRARELAVRGSNGTNPQTSLDAIKQEVQELYKQIVSIGNSEFNGKHVFNGQLTDQPPYTEADAMNLATDTGVIQFELGAGVKIPVSVTGNKVFGAPGDQDNIFQVFNDLIVSLGTSDTAGVEKSIGLMDKRIDQFLEVRSDIGAKTNRIQLMDSRLKDININLQTLQTNVEDADMAEVITQLKTNENVYQASLSVGSKLIRPSLVDFLR